MKSLDELGSVARGRSRHRPRDAAHLYGGEYPFVQTGDVRHAELYITSYDQTYSDAGLAQSKLWPAGTLCITIAANIAETAILGIDACFPDSVIGFIADECKSDTRFVKYKLDTVKAHYQQVSQGAAQDNLSLEKLLSLKLSVPDIDEQKEIASILTAYDDLIENNRRRMALLEEAARKLYREWFIRLRFPGHEHTLIHNGLPEGWERKTLGDICEAIRDITSPDQIDADTPYIGLEHIPRRSISQINWGRAENVTSSKHKFLAGDILFGKIRPYFHKVSLAFVDGVASADAIVIRPRKANLHSLALMTASSDDFVAVAAQTMKEGSKMPRADWKQMQSREILMPPKPILHAFNHQIVPITEQLRNLTFQTRKLRAARDRMLPKLMSGEIEV